jgi:predicted RNA binding protein YcfA (HicA-like mRNA interferase family)
MIEFLLPLYCQIITYKKKMKSYKVKEVIALLLADGWYLGTIKGSHRQFKHPVKKGKVTVNGKLNETRNQELLNSIWKQAGWK